MRELLNNDSLLAITEKMLGKKIGKDNIYKIQQAGTKYVGHVYFDVADDFLYECIVQTTGTTNTTANFKKCGIGENRDKLDNLFYVERFGYNHVNLNSPTYSGYDISHLISRGYTTFILHIGSFGACQIHILSMIDSRVNTGYYGVTAGQEGLSSVIIRDNKITVSAANTVESGTSVNLHGVIALKL